MVALSWRAQEMSNRKVPMLKPDDRKCTARMISSLVDCGASLDVETKCGLTALIAAAKFAKKNVMQVRLRCPAPGGDWFVFAN